MLMRTEPATRLPSMLRRLALAAVAAGVATGAGATAAVAAPAAPAAIRPAPGRVAHHNAPGPQQVMCPYMRCVPGPIRRQPVPIPPWSPAQRLRDLFPFISLPVGRSGADPAPPGRLCPVRAGDSGRCAHYR